MRERDYDTFGNICEECCEYDLSDEFDFCPYCGTEFHPRPSLTARQKRRRAWNELLYKLHLKKRPQLDEIMMIALANYKDVITENIFSESPLITYLKERDGRDHQ